VKRSVIAAVEDMFFAAKIRATAEQLDIDLRFPKSTDALFDSARASLPALVIVDLHSQRFDPFALAQRFKADEQLRGVPLVGFFSHVQTALQREAQQSGYDRVIPRSAFTKNLAEILQGKL
jgi:PleD family two-component response regulator